MRAPWANGSARRERLPGEGNDAGDEEEDDDAEAATDASYSDADFVEC